MVYGDVAGKSVSGALVMMAAHEALHSLAMSHQDPEELFDLANKRLYRLGHKKSFVALAYLTLAADGTGVDYLLAGQPQPLLKGRNGDGGRATLARAPTAPGRADQRRLPHLPCRCGPGRPDSGLLRRRRGCPLTRRRELRHRETERCGGQRSGQAEILIDQVVDALREFIEGTDPYDDVTLVAIACDREVL